MTKIDISNLPKVSNSSDRQAHRKICILAGGLAVLGGMLALLVEPWFMAVTAVGGVWLIFAPESSSPAAHRRR